MDQAGRVEPPAQHTPTCAGCRAWHHMAWALPPTPWCFVPSPVVSLRITGTSKELCVPHCLPHSICARSRSEVQRTRTVRRGGPGPIDAPGQHPGPAGPCNRAASTQASRTGTTGPGCPKSRGQCLYVSVSNALQTPHGSPHQAPEAAPVCARGPSGASGDTQTCRTCPQREGESSTPRLNSSMALGPRRRARLPDRPVRSRSCLQELPRSGATCGTGGARCTRGSGDCRGLAEPIANLTATCSLSTGPCWSSLAAPPSDSHDGSYSCRIATRE